MNSMISNDPIQQLTDAFLKCDSMQDPQKRGMIVSDLPKKIRTSIDRGNSAKDDVWAIVKRCSKFQDGISALLTAVRFRDGGTKGFIEVERLWNSFQGDISVDGAGTNQGNSMADEKNVPPLAKSSPFTDSAKSEQIETDPPDRGRNVKAKTDSIKDSAFPAIWEKVVAFSFGVVFLLIMIVIAIFIPDPTPDQSFTFRVAMSLAAAGVGAVIPGLIQLEVNQKYMPLVRAGGAIALFVLVYLFNPGKV